jgi:sporulation protein YlmC with PRC-barrel domain
MKASDIMGKKVIDMNANTVGKVSDIEFDLVDGIITSIKISLGLMKKKIEIKPEDIKTVGDTIILNIPKDDIV